MQHRQVNDADLALVKQVDAMLSARTGVRYLEVQGDLTRVLDGVSPLKWARDNDFNAARAVEEISQKLRLAPASSFPDQDEASYVNRSRAALVALACDNSEWKPGSGEHEGALLREGDDGQVIRLALTKSTDGQSWGFEISMADDATLVASPDGTHSVLPEDAEFSRIAAGRDIDDALAGYDSALEETMASAPKF